MCIMELFKVELMSAEWDILHWIFTWYLQPAIDTAFKGALLHASNVHLCLFPLELSTFQWKVIFLFRKTKPDPKPSNNQRCDISF